MLLYGRKPECWLLHFKVKLWLTRKKNRCASSPVFIECFLWWRCDTNFESWNLFTCQRNEMRSEHYQQQHRCFGWMSCLIFCSRKPFDAFWIHGIDVELIALLCFAQCTLQFMYVFFSRFTLSLALLSRLQCTPCCMNEPIDGWMNETFNRM